MPLPRLRSGLFELLTLPLRLLDEEPLLLELRPRSELLDDEAPMPLFELLLWSPLVAELPMPSPLRRSARLESELLPVLPVLERSLFDGLDGLLDGLLEAPKPLLSLLFELLFVLEELLFNPLRFELLDDEPLEF